MPSLFSILGLRRRTARTAPARRRLLGETLETRRLLSAGPQISGTAPSLLGGALTAGTASFQLRFSETVLGAGTAGNYQLQSLGADGLLGTADDAAIGLAATASTTAATLSFPALSASVYRLTVRDTVTGTDGRRLDGDGDGAAGGDWVTEFVVLPPSELFSATPAYSSGGTSPLALAVGDLNGDGRADVAVANNGSATVAVLVSQANGTLAAPVTYSSGGVSPRSVAIGDLNGDGRADLAVANSGSARVGVLLGQSGGSLAAAVTYSSGGSQPYGVAIGDLNGDGRADLAVANRGGGTVGVLLGQSDGKLATAVTYPSGGTAPCAVAIGDLNGDGGQDLAVANNGSATVAVLAGQTNGTLAAAAVYGSGGTSPNSVAIGDFDGDGRHDLAATNEASSSVGLLLGQSGGTLAAAVVCAAGDNSPLSAASGDFNDDGRADLAVANQGGNSVAVLLGQAGGSFLAATSYNSGGTYLYAVACGDLNGDGREDLAAANAGTGNVGVLMGQGDGEFSATATYLSGGVSPWSVAVADIDNDGRRDLAVINAASGNIGVLAGQAGGVSPAARYDCGGSTPWSIAIGDLSGDGRADLAAVNSGSGTVSVLLGQPGGAFAAATAYSTTAFSPWSVAMGDFNSDARGDLAVTNYYAGNVAVFLGQAGGTLAPAVTYNCGGSGAGSLSVAIGDLNSDGRADLAVANYEIGNVGVLLGQANGTFASLTTYSTGGTSPYSVAIGDLNSDGRADLAAANSASRNVGVLLGQAGGTLAAATTYDCGGNSPLCVAVGDLNADGRADLAVANSGSANVGVLLAQASGTLAPVATYSSGGKTPRSLAIGDINGDGRPDLAVANSDSGTVGVLWNTSAYPLYSPTRRLFDVQPSGSMAGQLVQGSPPAFDGLGRLRVGTVDYAPVASHLDLQDGKQTLVLPSQTLAGLTVHREITVPNTGTVDFARTVDVFCNATANSITTTVHILGNLGSDAATTVWKTSDGDGVAEATDEWIGTDDGDGTGSPTILHYLASPDGLHPSTVQRAGDRGDNVEWTFTLTVPANQTVRLAQLTILADSRAAAEAAANTLVTANGLGGQAVAFLTPDELATLANFVFVSHHSPAGADAIITVAEDASYMCSPADFGFSDPLDTPADALLAVKITTLPEAGDLRRDGIPVLAGDSIAAADLLAGRLTFTPAANANGPRYASFTFQVQDDGGSATGENDLDPTPNTITFSVTPTADVVGRYAFYNNSTWDSNQPELNDRDYDAIAPLPLLSGHGHPPQGNESAKELGKTALRPGQTASFIHYTSYSRGLNGLVIAIDTLAAPEAVTAADFRFRVGNSNTLDNWTTAPSPNALRIQQDATHAAFGGQPDVITIRWADDDPYTPQREPGAISNQWLQVVVLANPRTGLTADEVFYFANQIAESGNSTTDANVDQNDEIGTRNHPHTAFNVASIGDPYDFNRDGKVDQNDEILARNHSASAFTRIALITAPSMVPPAARTADQPAPAPSLDARDQWFAEFLAWEETRRKEKKETEERNRG